MNKNVKSPHMAGKLSSWRWQGQHLDNCLDSDNMTRCLHRTYFHPKISVVLCMVKHDDYMTPFSAWEDVSAYIPRHLTLWEAFYGDGTSGHHLTELGFDVIHEDVDFFAHDLGECVVTNPPCSELPRVLARLRELGKPFVVIMPCSTLTKRYFQAFFRTSR